MLELDTLHFPPAVSAILGLRSRGAIPLVWGDCPIRTVTSALDQTQDAKDLLKQDTIADESAAAAVRALLYLWGGWPSEAGMHAALASETASAYVQAFCLRQAGDSDTAKETLTNIGLHPIHAPLTAFACEQIGDTCPGALKRFRGVLEFGEQWEPFAFADAFEQARCGDFNDAGLQTVSNIQRREFELLLVQCLESAMGRSLNAFCDSRAKLKRARPRPRPAPTRRAGPVSRSGEPARGTSAEKAPLKPSGDVTVACPGCGARRVVPGSMCGSIIACGKCGKRYSIPIPESSSPASR